MKLLGYGGHQSLAIYLRKNNIFNWAENFAEMIGHQKVTNVLFTRFCLSSFFWRIFGKILLAQGLTFTLKLYLEVRFISAFYVPLRFQISSYNNAKLQLVPYR